MSEEHIHTRLKEAIDILQQSATGQMLVDTVSRSHYQFVVSEVSDWVGFVDHDKKIITLSAHYFEGETPIAALVMTLGHEFTHVSQKINGGMGFPLMALQPMESVHLMRLFEADALAHEARIAFELLPLHPTFREVLEGRRIGTMLKTLEKLPRKPTPEKIMHATFLSFYREATLLTTYAEHVISTIEEILKDNLKKAAMSQNFCHRLDWAEALKMLRQHSVPYLPEDIDLEKMKATGVSAAHQDRIEKVLALRERSRIPSRPMP